MKTLLVAALLLVLSVPAFAHVVVRPNQAGISAFQTFTVSVPNEKDMPTTALRLLIPEGLSYVTPTVKNGWRIDVKKSGEGGSAVVNEITWSGGSIPAGFRDDFSFSAQLPPEQGTVIWKAYQTYANGVVVSWDREQGSTVAGEESEDAGPYSKTEVTAGTGYSANASPAVSEAKAGTAGGDYTLVLILGCVSLLLSGIALAVALAKRT